MTSASVAASADEHQGEGQSAPRPGRRRALGLIILLALFALALVLSIAYGANPIPVPDALRGLLHRDSSEASVIVRTQRIPRTIVGIAVGAAFGVAGALIQAITRNPLADPGILGVNAGAGFAVTVGVGLLGVSSITGYVWFAFIGAAATTVGVYLIGSMARSASSPVTLVLAGVALGAVLNGLSSLLQLLDEDTFQSIRSWGLGAIDRTSLAETLGVLPFIVVGLVIAILLSGSLNSVALGDDLAASLGTSVVRVRILGILAVTLLAGGGTALTGGIGFLGLMVPHVVRWIVGPDQRWIIAYSILLAPTMLLGADVIGRVVARPSELEVGIVCAVIGAPVLIALVRRRKVSGL